MGLTTTALIVILLLVATGAYYMYASGQLGQRGYEASNTTSSANATITGSNTATGGTQTTSTTTTSMSGGSVNESVWDYTEEFVGVRLIRGHTPQPEPPPVLINGTFYDFSYAKVFFNYTEQGGLQLVFNTTWSLERESFTTSCRNRSNNAVFEANVEDGYKVAYTASFTSGYRFTATVYLLPNATTALDALGGVPWGDNAQSATPPGDLHSIVGGSVSSPDASGEWWAAMALLPIDQAAWCDPIVEGHPDVLGYVNKINQVLYTHAVASEFMPIELQNPHNILFDTSGRVIEDSAMGTGGPYQKYYYKITPVGVLEYPGTGLRFMVYNLTFWTEPDYVHGYYLITAESVVPLEYHAVFPHGDQYNGQPPNGPAFIVTIKLLDARLTPTNITTNS